MQRIYLDNSATTPVRPEVLEAMLPYLRDAYGNAGSVHAYGRAARRAVDDARDEVAALINADPRDIYFTSGGTEADNLAVRGRVAANSGRKCRMIVSSIEHHAVLHAAEYVRAHNGVDLVTVPVDKDGLVDPDQLESYLTDETALVSIMHANNETGAIQPVEKIAQSCVARGIVFHSDTVQSVGKITVDVQSCPIGMLAISAHKLYAPKGVGACYIRKGVDLVAQSIGGGQERERRAGTENVPGIVGLGKACALARAERDTAAKRIEALRDRLETGVLARVPGAVVNAANAPRLPGIANIAFPGVDGESLVLALDVAGFAVSSGAACTAGSLDPSHVLLAMGQSYETAQSAIRFSLGIYTTESEIDSLIAALPEVLARTRAGR
ncbi:MAG TPA: cysteine desulfurase family protein [Candidatus Hydrogenedentes bacterium]|nr:cysteine desulfurase family protein [Candidatus Hydrogenedentota bacterium]